MGKTAVDRRTEATARIFDIQRFSVHDGPGIRTTVFFKGCPLRCRWCHNPESISPIPQYLVYPARCTSCGLCPGTGLAGSAVGAESHARAGGTAEAESGGRAGGTTGAESGGRAGGTAGARPDSHSDGDLIRRKFGAAGCSATDRYPTCPYGAREVAGGDWSVEELADAATRDLPFYGQTGGVTFSGGEPLAQWEVVSALAEAVRARGAHVAIDTSAYAPAEVIAELPKTFDLVIVDLKAVDPELHRGWTGVENTRILQAIRSLASAMGDRLWISVPAIPGAQLGPELDRIEVFIRSLGRGPKARLIPYHRFGDAKYRALGVEPPEFPAPASGAVPLWQEDSNVPVSLVQ